MWEVDCSGLGVEKREDGMWEVNPHLRSWGSYLRWREYGGRHALYNTCFSARARAVDAVRLALREEPMTQPPILTHWQRQGEGIHHSRNGRWRLERGDGRSHLVPLSREARAQVEAYPEIKRILKKEQIWTLQQCGGWADWIDYSLNIHLEED